MVAMKRYPPRLLRPTLLLTLVMLAASVTGSEDSLPDSTVSTLSCVECAADDRENSGLTEGRETVVTMPRTPPARVPRYQAEQRQERLDVRRGAFDRKEVRPYDQSASDRYGEDF